MVVLKLVSLRELVLTHSIFFEAINHLNCSFCGGWAKAKSAFLDQLGALINSGDRRSNLL
jgi:hypothetical protein